MTSWDDTELKRAGELRRVADQLLRESEEILEREVPRAVNAGMRKTEIARIAHVSRPTIDKLLKR